MDKNNKFKSFIPENPNISFQEKEKQITEEKPTSKFKNYEVKLTGLPLNIRQEPSLSGNVVRVATLIEQHTVINEQNDWIQLEDSNWVMKKFTSIS